MRRSSSVVVVVGLPGLASAAERGGVLPNTELHGVRLEASVVNEDDDHPVERHAVEFTTEAAEVREAERDVLDAWVDVQSPWIVQRLYGTPQIAALEVADIEVEDIAGYQRIQALETAVALRSQREVEHERWCRDEASRIAADAAAEGLRCFGDPCGQYTVIGVDDGRAILQDVSRRPIFTIPLRDEFWWEPPERLLAAELAAPHVERTIARSGNFYGFGNVGPGAQVVAIELFGSDGTNAIAAFSLADGRRGATALLKRGEATEFSIAAPDGGAVFACLQGDGGCFTDDGTGRVPQRDFAVAEWLALPGGARLVGQLRDGGLAIDDPAGARTTVKGRNGKVRAVLAPHAGSCGSSRPRTTAAAPCGWSTRPPPG